MSQSRKFDALFLPEAFDFFKDIRDLEHPRDLVDFCSRNQSVNRYTLKPPTFGDNVETIEVKATELMSTPATTEFVETIISESSMVVGVTEKQNKPLNVENATSFEETKHVEFTVANTPSELVVIVESETVDSLVEKLPDLVLRRKPFKNKLPEVPDNIELTALTLDESIPYSYVHKCSQKSPPKNTAYSQYRQAVCKLLALHLPPERVGNRRRFCRVYVNAQELNYAESLRMIAVYRYNWSTTVGQANYIAETYLSHDYRSRRLKCVVPFAKITVSLPMKDYVCSDREYELFAAVGLTSLYQDQSNTTDYCILKPRYEKVPLYFTRAEDAPQYLRAKDYPVTYFVAFKPAVIVD